ncbi:Choline/ethanolamine kinase [Vibrio xiamenensis]|uniref:Choline/ethanolamine kinase n=1 Tax=Vibrio xiamenensis TaxID=861298 RepID=A0A1G8HDP6_9VIBR|nr:phosphotransferase [Vibrio xiamenensis]SDI04600.1 Choline/ethanolamine kinase [Vibrio xiamenensis]
MMMTVSQVKEDMLNTSVRQMIVIACFGSEQDRSQPSDAFPAIAMPGHSGLDGLIRPVVIGSEQSLAKTYHHDALTPYTFENAAGSYSKAGKLGIGPKLIVSDSATESLFMEYLRDGWRASVVTDFKDSAMLEKLVAVKKTWHQKGSSSLDLSAFDVFDRYKMVWDSLSSPLPLPANTDISIDVLTHLVGDIRKSVTASGSDLAILHGENTMSNVLISEDKKLKLVDFDRTTISDPMWDLAAMSLEVCTDDSDRNQLLEMYYGQTSASLLARLKLYSIVDDAVWAMWALLGETNTYRKGTELYKYAANRLVRIRHHLTQFELSKLNKEL